MSVTVETDPIKNGIWIKEKSGMSNPGVQATLLKAPRLTPTVRQHRTEESMNAFETLGLGLGALPLLGSARTRSVSPENPTGEKGKGGMAVPDPEKLPFSAAASDLG